MPTYQPTNKEYAIVPYDPQWAVRFEEVKQLLTRVFGARAIQIEHVGSTAVPGMAAKSLVDVLIVVPEIEKFQEEQAAMVRAGYVCKENYVVDRSFLFEGSKDGVRTALIHLLPEGHPDIRKLLSIRDYLRTHPERVAAYSELKCELQGAHPDDYISYRKGKRQFLDDLESDADAWYDISK